MATSSPLPNATFPVHGGVERVIERAATVQATVREAGAARHLPTYMVGFTIMALVTLTARALDETQVGFATELFALSAVALFSFVFLSSVVRGATKHVQAFVTTTARELRTARENEKLWAFAAQDPRVMNDIMLAKTRSESVLVDEMRAPTHLSQRAVLSERRIPSPVFTKYF